MKLRRVFLLFIIVTIIGILSLKSGRKRVKNFFISSHRKISYILSYKDWTTEKITSNNKYRDKTWVISFANNDTYKSAQVFLGLSAMRNGFKKIINYNENDIKDFAKKNPQIFKNYPKTGLWTWKPYLILETLNKIPDGDILFYLDSASSINNDLSEIFANFDDKNIDIIVFDHDFCKKLRKLDWKCTNENFTKKSFLKFMNLDKEKYLKSYQVLGGFVILRNNKRVRKFIKTWLNLSLKPDLIGSLSIDDKNIGEQNKYFEIHKEDQAILSALVYKNPKNIKVFSGEEFISFVQEGFKSNTNSISTHTRRKLDQSLLFLLRIDS